VRSGEQPWANIDTLHRQILDTLLTGFGVEGLAEHEIEHLNKIWHRLHGWPDSVEGLARLKQKHVISTLSNGNVAQLTNMGKHAGLPWDCVLSAETMGHYKPDLVVYETAARLLGWKPSEVMMVAAHPGDLRAAQRVGLRTAYVRRPLEHGPEKAAAATASPLGLPPGTGPDRFDFVVDSLTELADRLEQAGHVHHFNDPLGSPYGPAPYGTP
ncbi:MAG: 2-haloalkanoic acid dehalogenase, type, partial [Rhizobacter sp.]|nr:2-haloalkanoic acid dehalogenase, type [Rhizobacter sp.]